MAALFFGHKQAADDAQWEEADGDDDSASCIILRKSPDLNKKKEGEN